MSSDELIKHYCKELRFGKNIYESYLKINAVDFGDFLAQLLKMELDHRELTRKNRNLKSAGFDVIKTFEGYEFGDIQIPGSVSVEELKSGIISLYGDKFSGAIFGVGFYINSAWYAVNMEGKIASNI